MRGPLLACLLAASVGPLVPAIAQAQTEGVNPLVPKARKEIDEARFDDARKTLERALRDPDNTDDTLVELYRLLGIVNVYLGDNRGAETAFSELLRLSPDYTLPRTSAPQVREIFDRVKARARSGPRLRLQLFAPDEPQAGAPATFTAEISGMQRGYKAYFYYRRPGEGEYTADDFRLRSGNRYTAQVPAAFLPVERQDYFLEYYAEVKDGSGLRVTSAGDAFNPMRLTVRSALAEVGGGQVAQPVEEAKPWYKKWWVWVIVGGVVAGGAVTTYLLVSGAGPSTGTVPVTINVQ